MVAKKKKSKKVGWDQKKCLAHMVERYGTQTRWADLEVYLTAPEVESCYGPRCKDFEPGCACCEAWLQWNKTGKVSITVSRDEALKLLGIKVD